MIGTFVTSKAGHDKNQNYIILRDEAEYVYLSDGKYRTVDKPKRKNKKHIQRINQSVSSECLERIKDGCVTDAEIIKELKS